MLKEIINNLNVSVFYKDTHGKFQYCNEQFAKAAQLDSPTQAIGKTDYDMVWRKQAESFRSYDKMVMEGHPLINFRETQSRAQTTVCVLVNKTPFFQKNTCAGIVCSFIDIDNIEPKNRFYVSHDKQLVLTSDTDDIYLTRRETEILKAILMGKTAKRIAVEKAISRRTVETHTDQIKNKFSCNSKMDLICKATQLGINYHQLTTAQIE